MNKKARAELEPIRQLDQFSCVAASLYMCLKGYGLPCTLQEVAKVMGVKPMVGASWEDAMAAAQHYGFRATLVMPSTIGQLKQWTDSGVPVMIGWNPEGRPWSHASVVFDVTEEGVVFVADPNIPDPEQTVREVPKDEFYKKWSEKAAKYIIRRPALAIEREISKEGQPLVPSIPERGEEIIRVASQMPMKMVKLTKALGLKQFAKKAEVEMGNSRKANLDNLVSMYAEGVKLKGQALADWKKKHPELEENVENPPPSVKALTEKMQSKTASASRVASLWLKNQKKK